MFFDEGVRKIMPRTAKTVKFKMSRLLEKRKKKTTLPQQRQRLRKTD